MQQRMQSKIDLHVHSKYSDRPSEWFLRRIGAPECFVEPQDIYERGRAHGMDFITISDHNSIRGALDIAHLPGALISVEITTYFPDDACKIHCLATGLDERQFEMIQELRSSIYDLQRYLVEQDIVHTIAHPLFRVNDRMSIDHVEKLLVLFKRFEIINGSRDPRAARLAETVLGNLNDEMIQRMAERHGLEPAGPDPGKKWFTGGSDDHSGGNVGGAFTATPYAADAGELLAHLRRGDHEPGGSCGGSLVLGRSLYQIAYSYYKARFLGKNDGRPNIIGELFEKLLREAEPQAATGLGQRLAGGARLLAKSRQMRQLGPLERLIVEEFSTLFSKEEKRGAASVEHHDRRTFQVACHVGQVLGYSFLCKLERHIREGHLVDSLQTIASLAPVALSFAPYLAAFSNQHKDEPFLQAVATHFPAAAHLRLRSQRKAWVTDTFSDINGVCRTIQMLGKAAKQSGKKLTVISCLSETPQTNIELKNFRPVGSFKIPEYEMLELCFPPFLEVIEYIERNEFNEVIISTPGPLGLTALAAAKMLGLRTTGIYHTDFPLLVRHIAQDHALEQWTWRYMAWFYVAGRRPRAFQSRQARRAILAAPRAAGRVHLHLPGPRVARQKRGNAAAGLRAGGRARSGDQPGRGGRRAEPGRPPRPLPGSADPIHRILARRRTGHGLGQRRSDGLSFHHRYLRQRRAGGQFGRLAGHRLRPRRPARHRAAAPIGDHRRRDPAGRLGRRHGHALQRCGFAQSDARGVAAQCGRERLARRIGRVLGSRRCPRRRIHRRDVSQHHRRAARGADCDGCGMRTGFETPLSRARARGRG